ncbi:MAG: hypothetical protein CVV51_01770 [Spirochaetae bacterium HGW-Spirochaetae-7]|jgi:uncharacterized membrane protein|nr:MAG: hypothetical protein CVV51_01770 [Spirochaetae bacterium HGW-Spirochaetae-7]
MNWFIIASMALRVLCLAFVVLLVSRIAAGFRGHGKDGALAALERRFVAGEVAEEDYRHMRDILKS